MSLTSIRCPNCAGSESLIVGENQYQCKFCDNTFHFDNPNTPKITKNITVQESNHCPICGKGVTFGTNNRCTVCGTSNLCNNCTDETPEKKTICKNCLKSKELNCLVCGKHAKTFCPYCTILHEKDPSHVITRSCSVHSTHYFIFVSMDHTAYLYYHCAKCNLTPCETCRGKRGMWGDSYNCQQCGKKFKTIKLISEKELKQQNTDLTEWIMNQDRNE